MGCLQIGAKFEQISILEHIQKIYHIPSRSHHYQALELIVLKSEDCLYNLGNPDFADISILPKTSTFQSQINFAEQCYNHMPALLAMNFNNDSEVYAEVKRITNNIDRDSGIGLRMKEGRFHDEAYYKEQSISSVINGLPPNSTALQKPTMFFTDDFSNQSLFKFISLEKAITVSRFFEICQKATEAKQKLIVTENGVETVSTITGLLGLAVDAERVSYI
uniref:Uncharacterized protein n=1 Tax=Panagrolaimus davidi TaxID=227884 RepID=A0A914PAE1_9BILA